MDPERYLLNFFVYCTEGTIFDHIFDFSSNHVSYIKSIFITVTGRWKVGCKLWLRFFLFSLTQFPFLAYFSLFTSNFHFIFLKYFSNFSTIFLEISLYCHLLFKTDILQIFSKYPSHICQTLFIKFVNWHTVYSDRF